MRNNPIYYLFVYCSYDYLIVHEFLLLLPPPFQRRQLYKCLRFLSLEEYRYLGYYVEYI